MKWVQAFFLMGYNPREHVCELLDFECMRKNDRNVDMWKDFNNFLLYKSNLFPNHTLTDMLQSVV